MTRADTVKAARDAGVGASIALSGLAVLALALAPLHTQPQLAPKPEPMRAILIETVTVPASVTVKADRLELEPAKTGVNALVPMTPTERVAMDFALREAFGGIVDPPAPSAATQALKRVRDRLGPEPTPSKAEPPPKKTEARERTLCQALRLRTVWIDQWRWRCRR
jgi:outer membrane biosynthesis protein TonB